MTLQEFLVKWNGKYIDFDGVYGNQCIDLLHQYCMEVLELTDGRILAAPAAKDIWLNFDNVFGKKHFEKIDNTPTGIPNEEDIIVWTDGTWGHVAIFVEGDTNSFRSFDQNYPTGSPCHVQNHNYNGVAGWLRFKPSTTTVAIESDVFINLVRKSTIYDKVREKLNVADNEVIVLGELDKLISYEDLLILKDKQIIEAENKIKDIQNQFEELKIEYQKLENNNEELVENISAQTNTIAKYNEELQTAQQELKELKEQLQKPIFTGWRLFIYKLLVRR